MSGMIAGVGVPHRRRINHHNQRPPHNHTLYLGEQINPSMDLNETALKARQRLEKKLFRHCLHLPSSRPIGGEDRNPKTEQTKDENWGSKLGYNIKRPWKLERSESDGKVRSCC